MKSAPLAIVFICCLNDSIYGIVAASSKTPEGAWGYNHGRWGPEEPGIKTSDGDIAALDDEPTRKVNDGNKTDGIEEYQVGGLKVEDHEIGRIYTVATIGRYRCP